ncbi:hypothetical protein Tco_1368954 [Tanacetum coccineum]
MKMIFYATETIIDKVYVVVFGRRSEKRRRNEGKKERTQDPRWASKKGKTKKGESVREQLRPPPSERTTIKKGEGWTVWVIGDWSYRGSGDAVDGLREEVTQFVGSGVESLVRKLLSSDEFHVALAHVASLGINYGVERGLRMGRSELIEQRFAAMVGYRKKKWGMNENERF